jgi:hypothetical protein
MSENRRANNRRASEDRRRRDRRRAGDDRKLVVEIVGAELHVVAYTQRDAGQPDQLIADSIVWKDQAAALHAPEARDDLAKALRTLVKKHALHGVPMRVVLSGENCVTRVIRGTVETVRSELAQLEQRSRLYLSLGPGPKVVVSWAREMDARHRHVLAVVCNKATLNAINYAAEAAGLPIAGIETVLSAVNRALAKTDLPPLDPCLIVHMAEGSAEIGIAGHGMLLLDYRPGGQITPETISQLVKEHLNRLQRHVGRMLRTPPPKLECVYLSGEERSVSLVGRHLRELPNLDVHVVTGADVHGKWQLTQDETQSATLAVMGGLLGELAESNHDAPDLLQHILEGAREPMRPVLVRSAIPLAATLLLAIGLFFFNTATKMELTGLQAELELLAPAQTRARELMLQLGSMQTKLKHLGTLAEQLDGEVGTAVVTRIANCMPSDVWLDRLELVDLEFAQLRGASIVEAGIYDFVGWLELAPGLEETALRGTSPASSPLGPITGFDIEIKLGELEAPARKVARSE